MSTETCRSFKTRGDNMKKVRDELEIMINNSIGFENDEWSLLYDYNTSRVFRANFRKQKENNKGDSPSK